MTMTASVAAYTGSNPVAHRPRPHGFDRAVMKVGFALLIWARRRAEHRASHRIPLMPEQQQSRIAHERALNEREREWALRQYRLSR